MEIETINTTCFQKLEMDGSFVHEMEIAYTSRCKSYRLYLKRDNHDGFRAAAIFNPFSDHTDKSWENNDEHPLMVDVLFSAWACFDGIRHLYFNEYISTPCLESLSEMLKELRKLEESICPEADS